MPISRQSTIIEIIQSILRVPLVVIVVVIMVAVVAGGSCWHDVTRLLLCG